MEFPFPVVACCLSSKFVKLLRGSQRVHFSSSKRWLWCQTVVLKRKNLPEIDSRNNSRQLLAFRFRWLLVVCVQNLSNCCRHENVWRLLYFNFWRDFTIWPNSGANQWRLAPNIIGSPCYATDKNGHTRLSSLIFLITVMPVFFFFGIFSHLCGFIRNSAVLLISEKICYLYCFLRNM